MSANMPQQPSSSASPPKKGLPAIAWVGLGCGGLLVLTVVVVVLGGMFLWGRAKSVVEEYAENPALAQARIMAMANPDIEIVSEDKAAGTITLRDKESGETFTLDSATGFAEGMMRFETDEGEEVVIDDTGQIIVTGEEGTTTVRREGQDVRFTGPDGAESITGPGAEQRIPDWVVIYTGAHYSFGSVTMSGTTIAGNTTFASGDQPDSIINFYRERLEAQGFEVMVRPSP